MITTRKDPVVVPMVWLELVREPPAAYLNRWLFKFSGQRFPAMFEYTPAQAAELIAGGYGREMRRVDGLSFVAASPEETSEAFLIS